MSGKSERVVVMMSHACKSVLTAMAEKEGLGIGECYYRRVRQSIHQQAVACDFMSDLLEEHGIPIDGGADKECFGPLCAYCTNRVACRTRVYTGVVHLKEEVLQDIKPGRAAHIREMQSEAGQSCQDFPQLCNKN